MRPEGVPTPIEDTAAEQAPTHEEALDSMAKDLMNDIYPTEQSSDSQPEKLYSESQSEDNKEVPERNPEQTREESVSAPKPEGAQEAPKDPSERAGETLTPENFGRFSRLSPGAKGFFGGLYENVYKGSFLERFVKKHEIASNQANIDRFAERSDNLQSKFKAKDGEFKVLEVQETELRNAIEVMQQQGITNINPTERLLEGVLRQKDLLKQKMDRLNMQIESNNRFISNFAEKRDAAAESMANFYAEKAEPFERDLKELEDRESLLEFQALTQEIEHENAIKDLQDIVDKREQLLEIAHSQKMSKSKTRKLVSALDQRIASVRDQINAEQSLMKHKQREVAESLAQVRGRVRPHQDKVKMFNRVRERSEAHVDTDPLPETEYTSAETIEDEFEDFASEENMDAMTELPAGTFVEKWNKHLQDKFPQEVDKLVIDPVDFFRRQTGAWRSTRKMDYNQFERIVEGYYKFKKVDFSNAEAVKGGFREDLADQE